jgi:hypothetical protein
MQVLDIKSLPEEICIDSIIIKNLNVIYIGVDNRESRIAFEIRNNAYKNVYFILKLKMYDNDYLPLCEKKFYISLNSNEEEIHYCNLGGYRWYEIDFLKFDIIYEKTSKEKITSFDELE